MPRFFRNRGAGRDAVRYSRACYVHRRSSFQPFGEYSVFTATSSATPTVHPARMPCLFTIILRIRK